MAAADHQMPPLQAETDQHPGTRYFLIKSFNFENVVAALQYCVWATTPRTEETLARALATSASVILFFSINGSSRFSGYAAMKSKPGDSAVAADIFVTPDGRPFWGRTFDIAWLRKCELPFTECQHLRNSLNENKPVKIGRDGQEVSPECGSQLCELFDEKCPHQRSSGGEGWTQPSGVPMPDARPRAATHSYCINAAGSNAGDPMLYASVQPGMYTAAHESQNVSASFHFPSSGDFPALISNAALRIFPIDLTDMTYDDYIDLFQKSLSRRQEEEKRRELQSYND